MDITKYTILIRKFITDAISALDFERDYLRLYKSDDRIFPPEIYDILNELFFDVDAFCADSTLRGEDDIDEPTLKARAQSAYDALLKF